MEVTKEVTKISNDQVTEKDTLHEDQNTFEIDNVLNDDENNPVDIHNLDPDVLDDEQKSKFTEYLDKEETSLKQKSNYFRETPSYDNQKKSEKVENYKDFNMGHLNLDNLTP